MQNTIDCIIRLKVPKRKQNHFLVLEPQLNISRSSFNQLFAETWKYDINVVEKVLRKGSEKAGL
jgi:hypothetical protein